MTPVETVKAAIGGTPCSRWPDFIRACLSFALSSDVEADSLLTEAARRAIEAMPITDAMVEAASSAFVVRLPAGSNCLFADMRVALEAAKASAMGEQP